MLDRFDITETERLERPFAVTGRQAYLIGAMDGGFPDMGQHLPGEMGGLWAYPLKLADGFWFGVSAAGSAEPPGQEGQPEAVEWMHGANCRAFTMRPGRAERTFSFESALLRAVQEIWIPEAEPGVIVSLTLVNPSGQDLSLRLHWLVRFDLQGAWWSGWPDRADNASFDAGAGGIVAHDSGTPGWAACMLATGMPLRYGVGVDLWADEKTGSVNGERDRKRGILRNPAELRGQGISGELSYAVDLGPHEGRTMHFAIAGGTEGAQAAAQTAKDLLDSQEALLEAKLEIQRSLVESAPVLRSPDEAMNTAFAQQNLCMDMLTLDVPAVGRGEVAGLQNFGWFFGCDTYYSVSGLLVAGQSATALDNLRILARYAEKQQGRIPHEIVPTGDLFNAGNTVETGEYTTAVERAFRWTGNRDFLRDVYQVCREGIFDYMLGTCDPEGNLLPDGPGILELRSAGHGKKLDVACSLYQGLLSLAYLAQAMDDEPVRLRSLRLAAQVKTRILRYFWLPDRQEFAWRIEPDLSVWPGEPAHSYVVLEMGVLDSSEQERIDILFDKVEGPEHTGPAGVIHPGTSDFVMPIQNAMVALAEFRYNRPERGLWYLQRITELAGHYMPWAIPEYVGKNACFLQAWSSASHNWLAVQGCFRLNPDPQRGVIEVQPQLPEGWDYLEVRNLMIWGTPHNLRLERTGSGIAFNAEIGTGTDTGTGGQSLFKVIENGAVPVTFV